MNQNTFDLAGAIRLEDIVPYPPTSSSIFLVTRAEKGVRMLA
jgi:hypothetical protein